MPNGDDGFEDVDEYYGGHIAQRSKLAYEIFALPPV
jgi:hypothetical protein